MERYRKPYRIKKKKSFLKSRFFWFLIFTFFITAGIFYLTCFSSIFQIKEIKIFGNEKVASEDIKNLIKEKTIEKFLFLESKSIFLINLSEINKTVLKEFPQIFKIDAKRKFPDKILVKIEERKPLAIFCQAENCFFIDAKGIAFEATPLREDFIKLKREDFDSEIKIGEEVIKEALISQILDIQSRLKENLKVFPKEASIISEERLNVKTSENWEIYFNLKEDLNWQLTKLSLVLKERIPPEKRRNLEYIDLRFEKVYIFPATYQ